MAHFSSLLFHILMLSIISTSISSITHSSLNVVEKSYINDNEFISPQCLTVPPSVFLSSVRMTIEEMRKAISILSTFTSFYGDSKLSYAVGDCLDLLDFSVDELIWTLSAFNPSYLNQNAAGKASSTGRLHFDLRMWLSAALGNQDTCIQGFDGVNSFFKGIVQGNVALISSQVSDVLNMVTQLSTKKSNHAQSHPGFGRSSKFPSWVKPKDRRLLELSIDGMPVDVIVAADGTGNYTTIAEAILNAPDSSNRRYVIYVKNGTYYENIEIKKKKWNLMMVGDGMNNTIISGNRSVVDGWTTYRSATFAVSGRGFLAKDMTFENTAGPQKHQAVAMRSDSDLSAFFRCDFKGYQDTLYAHSLRQFYRECKIRGTVDFIFGNGAAVFQNCQILPKYGLPNQKNTITAHGRKYANMTTGFSFQFCNITADSDLLPSINSTYTYLGRPWKLYSKTIFMQSYMSNVIRPEGWLEWNASFALDTLYYAEYMNYGAGSSIEKRVNWTGYHIINTTAEANQFTVSTFIGGNVWLPTTGVKYTLGLENN